MLARSSTHRSPVWAVALVLALATGAVLGQVVAVVHAPADDAGAGGATTAAVRAFYEAANAVIRTGDDNALDRVLDPTFVDHAAAPGATPDRAGLGRSLIAVHVLAPAAHLAVSQVVAAGDRAVARVAVAGTEHAAFVGAEFRGGVPIWGDFDAFRIAGGRVAERWDGASSPVALLPLAQLSLATDPTTGVGLTLERVTFEPGDHAVGAVEEARVLAVETGRLTVAVDAASVAQPLLVRAETANGEAPTAVVAGRSATLASGDLIVLPMTATYVLSDDGGAPATVLVAAVFSSDDRWRAGAEIDPANPPTGSLVAAALSAPDGPWPAGLAVQPLGKVASPGVPVETGTVGIGRIVLAPGAWLPTLTSPGPLLLMVEAGALDHGTGDGAREEAPQGRLKAGDGAAVQAGAILSLHNPGTLPAAVLVVAVTANRVAAAHPRDGR
jgi:hypothetical protein